MARLERFENRLQAGALLAQRLGSYARRPDVIVLALHEKNPAAQALFERRLERAIGVIYLPETERQSHYFYAHLLQQFDAVLHFDKPHAVEPLELTSGWKTGEVPETFPVGV